METDLLNKTFVVTGATSGIGQAVAAALAQRGAGIIGTGRSPERCRQAEARLRALRPAGSINYLAADLSVQSEVHRLADEVMETLNARGLAHLDGLVNNAGTFTYWLALTPDGIETQWAVNHLAPFLLTARLLGALQAAPRARVVTVSSDSHYGSHIDWQDPQLRRRYNGLRAYGNTKLANILFTLELNRRLGTQSSVRAFAADPGLVKTDIGLKGTPAVVNWVWKLRRSGGITPEESARGIVFLLTEPSIHDSAEIYWKDGHPKRASRAALDEQAAARLWALSEQMCGMKNEEPAYASA